MSLNPLRKDGPLGAPAAVSLHSRSEGATRSAQCVSGKMTAKTTTMLSWSGAVQTARFRCFRRGSISLSAALAKIVTAKTCGHL